MTRINVEKLQSLVGTVFGELTVVEYLGYYAKEGWKSKEHWFKCQCSCGNVVNVDKRHLLAKKGHSTRSCGCLKPKKHGYYYEPVYMIYKCMMNRVRNPHPYYHRRYIEKNIGVCDEWNGHPEVFCEWALKNGYKKGLSLDRIDNDGDYSPDNCRFVTSTVQANNRGSYNHNITYNGKTQSLAMWARELGIPDSTIRSRLDSGYSIEDTFSKEFVPNRNKKKV